MCIHKKIKKTMNKIKKQNIKPPRQNTQEDVNASSNEKYHKTCTRLNTYK